MPFTRGVIGLVLVGFGLACADFKELVVLQQGLAHEFESPAINVKRSGSGYLTVVFANSPRAKLPEPERAAFARRVAEFVRDRYPTYEQLQSIQVGFTSVHSAGGFRISSTSVPYRFTASDLGSPKGVRDGPIREVAAQRIPEQRVLLIMISRSDRQGAWIVTGRAQTHESQFQVIPDSGGAPIPVRDVDVRENAFDPGLLPLLVGNEYWTLALHLSRDVTRCIPMFVDDDVPPGARSVPGFLAGLATGPGGKIFLMQR